VKKKAKARKVAPKVRVVSEKKVAAFDAFTGPQCVGCGKQTVLKATCPGCGSTADITHTVYKRLEAVKEKR